MRQRGLLEPDNTEHTQKAVFVSKYKKKSKPSMTPPTGPETRNHSSNLMFIRYEI